MTHIDGYSEMLGLLLEAKSCLVVGI